MKKHVKLVDNRGCTGQSIHELRTIIRGIDAGDIISIATVFIRRNGSMKAYFDADCPIRALGSVDLLKDYIRHKNFELS